MTNAGTVRVLVAEDNEDHRFFIERALRRLDGVDVDVDSVGDGEDALAYLYRRGPFEDRERPHLILLDLKMPKIDGLEVLAAVKGDPELSTIPVAVLSSSDRPEDVDAAYGNACNSYVVKPTSMGCEDALRSVGEFWTEVVALPGRRG